VKTLIALPIFFFFLLFSLSFTNAQPIISINSPLNQTYQNGTAPLNISISESANLTIYLNERNMTHLQNVTEYYTIIYGKETFNLTAYAENENGTDEKSVIFTLVNGRASINVTGCGNLATGLETYYLTQDIIDSNADPCIKIMYGVGSIVFDCQWHIIDGINSGNGISNGGTNSNITIKNCILTDWTNGMYLNRPDTFTLENLELRNNSLDINYRSYKGECRFSLINATGTGDKPIVFFNTSNTVIKDWDNNASEIILCGADSSVIDNITLNYNGLILAGTSYTNISNLLFNNSKIYLFGYSNYNILSNLTTNGIVLDECQYNNFSNIVTRNSDVGISFTAFDQYNIFSNTTVESNYYGILFGYQCNGNTIKDSIIKNNNYAIYVTAAAAGNLIYNNLFNNTNNIRTWGSYGSNQFNTTRQAGTRIYSAGTEIGGNYWTNPNGNGYSDTCADVDRDGFCDQPYDLLGDGSNVDYLPLSNKYAYLSITFSYSSVDFGTLQHNTNNPAPDQFSGIYNVSVDTNANYVVKAYGTDFSDGVGHSFAISNLKFDTNSSAENLDINQAITLSTSPQTIDTYPPTTTVNYHGYWLSIPYKQYASTYTTTVVISYETA
jgi:hypothetical protein